MLLAENYKVIQTLTPDRSDQPFGKTAPKENPPARAGFVLVGLFALSGVCQAPRSRQPPPDTNVELGLCHRRFFIERKAIRAKGKPAGEGGFRFGRVVRIVGCMSSTPFPSIAPRRECRVRPVPQAFLH
jgi:hypothetical protein